MNISKNQQQYYNKNTKDLPELIIGSKVSILQENDTWLPATVIDKCTEPRSYNVKTQNDEKSLRHNRRHLRGVYRPQRWPTYNIPTQGINTSQSQQTNMDHIGKFNTYSYNNSTGPAHTNADQTSRGTNANTIRTA